MPDYLKPDFNGTGINHLRTDIAKWCRWMREESCVEWSEFLESGLNQMSSGTLSSDDQLWPLQIAAIAHLILSMKNRVTELMNLIVHPC